MGKLVKFEFTHDIYTGVKEGVIVPINDMIEAIKKSLATEIDWVRPGYDLEFLIFNDYIVRLRKSPEYHDAAMDLILSKPEHNSFIVPQYRCNAFKEWKELMRQYGVMGTVSIHQNYNYLV